MRSVRYLGAIALILALICLPVLANDPAPLPYVQGSWTLVVLPDTQFYSEQYPEIFRSQTKWIADNNDRRNIALVLHEGDVINKNTTAQWENARKAMAILDGKAPYAIAPGNHDYNNIPKHDTVMSQYFPVDHYRSLPTFGGVYERKRIENSYHLFSAGGRDWVAIALEMSPRDSVVSWANKVLKKYPTRSGIVVTHAYLDNDNTLLEPGKELWKKLISGSPNVAFVCCGHVTGKGTGRLTSVGAHGNKVHQILIDCQMMEKGGSGYLRLMEFLPDGKTVQCKTYSPYLDKYLTDDEHQFTLEVPPNPSPTLL